MSENRFVRTVDRFTDRLGRFISWLVLAMVLIGAYNAIVRYLGRFMSSNLSSNMYLELQWYLFSVVFLLGTGYALKEDAHVRVDVMYGQLGKRAKAWINVAGSVLFLLPFSVFVLFMSWPSVRNSWQILEVSPDPGGLPRYPLKTFILLCFGLLLLQGISELIKDIETLRSDDESNPGAALQEVASTSESSPGAETNDAETRDAATGSSDTVPDPSVAGTHDEEPL